ncbi:CG5612 [Drosophila busckii]|uniref:CG5612 n=1 Tax=Drosophila busckii TaxID=30019 RepID=A0A0M5IZN7_DROBS|nr:uncharacterized protein LOC108603115 [Drosophila busckii]ALC45956.1 CG5612 [Drosophila busckii]
MCALYMFGLLMFAVLGSSSAELNYERYFAVGNRADNDQLLMRDVQHSRPATLNESASISFSYNLVEPITFIEIVSEENISAEVKFSYTDHLIVGRISLVIENASEPVPSAFKVTISIYGFNDSRLIANPAQLLNTDPYIEGRLRSNADAEMDDIDYDVFDRVENGTELLLVSEQGTDAPIPNNKTDFDSLKDKIIDKGERQAGDEMIYETYQTDIGTEQNQTLVFYFVDSVYITYVKFIFVGWYESHGINDEAPVVEYSHYTPQTLKATITAYNTKTLFVVMFVYGYRTRQQPAGYKAFMGPEVKTPAQTPELTPMQRLQLLLLSGKRTTASSGATAADDDDDDGSADGINPDDMKPAARPNAAVAATDQHLYAMLGLMLFAVV